METNGNFLEKVRNAFGRTADRMAGRHVPILHDVEALDDVASRPHATPRADVLESEREILIRADVPGASSDNARVHWGDDHTLHVHVQVEAAPHRRSLLEEWTPRDWYRAFRLPANADGSAARCHVERGVLSIHVPKREPKPVRIPIRTAG